MRRSTPLVSIAALLLMASACSSDPAPDRIGGPSEPSRSTTATETPTTEPVVNGRVQNMSGYLARARRACKRCEMPRRSGISVYDTGAGRVFVLQDKTLASFTVIAPDGERTRVPCGAVFTCPRTQYSSGPEIVSGPGADELSVLSPAHYSRSSADQRLRVIGLDGAVRRTINLSARLPKGARVADLAWSPDGRLAVTTRCALWKKQRGPGGRRSRVWLIEGDGEPQLVHTASSYDGPVPARYERQSASRPGDFLGHIYGTAWSPDGSRLAFGEFYGPTAPSGMLTWYSFATAIFSLTVPDAGQDEPGTERVLHDYRGYPGTGNKDVVWSPDGTRIAFRTWRRVFELSAEDGTVLARRPIKGDGLIWPEAGR